jgi:Polyketide cyclase / dehydrase and lipid transport
MLKTTLAALALAVMLPAAALAHGPTRQKVVQSVEINAPADKVWAVIGKFQNMGWHPAMAKTEGTGENVPGAKRTLTLSSGGKIEESLTAYSAENKALSYEITNVDVKTLPVSNYSSSIRVTADGAKSIVEWKGAFYRGFVNNDPPPELNDEAAIKAVTDVYRAGLDALKAKLEAGG